MVGLVFIGDDFTGASDTLATLAERGAKVRLFLDSPDESEVYGLDAVGIATDLRARPPDEISEIICGLAPAISSLAPRFVHYKVCSTFDSSPTVGSIGAAVRAMETSLSPARTVIVGGQPSLGRYCAFGNLFARASDGRVCRIDRHPIMRVHPVTPMDEADLRIHLGRQGIGELSLVTRQQLHSKSSDPEKNFGQRSLADAMDQSDIRRIGEVLRRLQGGTAPSLVVGASSVAEALWPKTGAKPREAGARRAGPRLAVVGSRSAATAAQVAASESYERIPLDREHLGIGQTDLATRCANLLAAGGDVLIHLQRECDYAMSPAQLSQQLAELTAAIVRDIDVPAIAIAGGDTSSTIVKRLGFRSLSFVARAGAGVAVCRGNAIGSELDGTLLLLKGGQVGDVLILENFGR